MSSTGNNRKGLVSKKARENFAQLAKGDLDVEGLKRLSPAPIPENEVEMALALVNTTHRLDEYLNIVSSSFLNIKAEKPSPLQPGETRTVKEWNEFIRRLGHVPQCSAGSWFQPNPVGSEPIGKGFADKDVLRYGHCLVEWDDFPVEQQIVAAASLALPITAILTSGSKSVHILVRLDAKTLDEYKSATKRLFGYLKMLGVDPSTKNPARMTRLPGAYRAVGPDDFQLQELLYLNSNPESKPILGKL